jgi:transposase-like protein
MGRGEDTALEFKQEVVQLVESGQTLAAAAGSLGVIEQTRGNWVKLQMPHLGGTAKSGKA